MHVDDILIGGTDKQVTEVSKNLRRQFNMTENDVGHFLGIRVERNKDGTILLTQDAYVDKLLATFDMQECATRNTPAGEILKAGTPQPEGEEQEEIPEYRRLLGALQYISVDHYKTRHHLCSESSSKILPATDERSPDSCQAYTPLSKGNQALWLEVRACQKERWSCKHHRGP
jgi:hypothetical protein